MSSIWSLESIQMQKTFDCTELAIGVGKKLSQINPKKLLTNILLRYRIENNLKLHKGIYFP